MAAEQQVFWIDGRYDRERAQEGPSRYTEHLWAHLEEFDGSWGDIAPVVFACAAWRIATPPLMSPGLVRGHRRILEATCVRNTWDGSLTARVTPASPLPTPLSESRHWWRDRGWQDWPEVFGQFVDPTDQDLAKVPHLRAHLVVDAPLPLDRFPAAPETPGRYFEEAARRAVSVVAEELNALVAPIITQLENAQ